jgi:hypothetical protein
MAGEGREPSPRLDDARVRLRWSGEVRQMWAIGSEEIIDVKWRRVSFLGQC